LGAAGAAATFPELANRISDELGWVVLTFEFRGCGDSEGDFSLHGWLDDVLAAINHLRHLSRAEHVWLAGFGTGGALSIVAGAHDPMVQGVAAIGAPADFDDWAGHPRRLLQHAREIGAIRDPNFPRNTDAWSRELREIRPISLVSDLAPRPLLVMHGSEDLTVPHFDARVLSDAHQSAELSLISGAGHQLRHDPRAIAILLGWLDRQSEFLPA
jgi:putative redox protein